LQREITQKKLLAIYTVSKLYAIFKALVSCDEVSMATRQVASKRNRSSAGGVGDARPGRSSPLAGDRQNKHKEKTGSAGRGYGVPVPERLYEAIETERGNLAKAESLLGCMMISMEYETDSETGPHYPDVAQVARDLVRNSIDALDSLTLQRYLSRNKVKEESGPPITDSLCGYRQLSRSGPRNGPRNGILLLAEAR
jgi:hypothetical protein